MTICFVYHSVSAPDKAVELGRTVSFDLES